MKTQHKRLLQRTYIVLIFGFMYLPIAVLIAYSFNENRSRAVVSGGDGAWHAGNNWDQCDGTARPAGYQQHQLCAGCQP